MKNRAITPEQKRTVIERLYAAWLRAPELRLGQLIENAISTMPGLHPDLFMYEDFELAVTVERFIKDSCK